VPPPSDHELLQQLDWVRSLAARLVFDRSQRDDLEQEIWHAAARPSGKRHENEGAVTTTTTTTSTAEVAP
jgi:hypothetical protein